MAGMGYYPAYAPPMYLDEQGYPSTDSLPYPHPHPAYHPAAYQQATPVVWNPETQAYHVASASGPQMMYQEGSFGTAELSPYEEGVTLENATGFVGDESAEYMHGGHGGNRAIAHHSPGELPEPKKKKPPPSVWLDAVSRAYDAPTNTNMVMKRESEPEEPVEAIAAPASSVMGQGKPPPPPLAVPGQDGPQQMPSDNFYPQEYPYHYGDEYYHPQHHRGYHSHPYSAPIYMSSVPTTPQHMSTTPSCAQCERCAQRDRDYDRLQELLVLQGGAGAAAAARTKQDSGGNNMGTTAEGLEKELESPRKDKPDAELIWDGTTWDAFPFLFMCCAPLCCVVRRWHITEDRIDLVHSCCGTKEDTIYVRRIKDVSLGGDCLTSLFCCGRNTVVVHAADQTHPELRITTWGARDIFHKLRDAKDERHGIMLEDND